MTLKIAYKTLRPLAGYILAGLAYTLTDSAARILRGSAKACKGDVKCLVDLSYNFDMRLANMWKTLPQQVVRLFGIRPSQVREEIIELLKILKELRPRRILEIGTALRGTFFLFSWVSERDATLISIDLPGGPFGGGYPFWRTRFYKSFTQPGQRAVLIRGDSHSKKTLEKVGKVLGDEMLDFLFIDGDHTYYGVKMDFKTYSPLVRKGGIVAFHDIVPHPPELRVGVPKFWSEIKIKFLYKEIVKDWNQRWAGIGVIYV